MRKITTALLFTIAAVATCAIVTIAAPSTVHAAAPVVVIQGMLVDRQCSVEDVFQLQPESEKRCTLTFQELTAGNDGVFRRWTVYCPNKAVDGNPHNSAYYVCSDPNGLQIRHAGRTYIVHGWLRTAEQQKDGLGQVNGYQFQT